RPWRRHGNDDVVDSVVGWYFDGDEDEGWGWSRGGGDAIDGGSMVGWGSGGGDGASCDEMLVGMMMDGVSFLLSVMFDDSHQRGLWIWSYDDEEAVVLSSGGISGWRMQRGDAVDSGVVVVASGGE
ncbi:hypothetical protein Tco_0781510, partial [Tanacetum coccineum]